MSGTDCCFNAQDVTVTGQVTDASDDTPLPGVNITVKGTGQGTSTNVDGLFELEVDSPSDTLMFSFVGYQIQESPLNGQSELEVQMQQVAISGDEVIVVGYGSQDREDLIGSVSPVSAEDLENRSVTQLSNALTGQMPGVTLIQRSGQPGNNDSKIRVRGVGSFGASSDALILIDGIPGEDGTWVVRVLSKIISLG